ncbi:hypothetical protein FRX31_030862 [Thalictrum thalictroides]|uniref:Uncharacterized protein n=1 Tax=Thalictrum thalictroides TaxID=46969 RepID=A0A7J6V5N7_THATH|nr:hypothetical protein FRX31_030862 [Thalictrum thalictroides]
MEALGLCISQINHLHLNYNACDGMELVYLVWETSLHHDGAVTEHVHCSCSLVFWGCLMILQVWRPRGDIS